MKYPLPLALIITLFMSWPNSGKAESPQAFLKVNQYYLFFTNPVVPYINQHGSFLVGIQGFSDFLGGKLVTENGTETMRLGNDSVKFVKNSKTAFINGEAVEMAEAPQERPTIQPNIRAHPPAVQKLFARGPATQMLVPVALLARAFHFQSSWDARTQTVRLQRKDLVLPNDTSIEDENLERFEHPRLTEDDLVPVKAVVRSGAVSFSALPSTAAEAKGRLLELTVKNASRHDFARGQAYINIFTSGFDKGMPMPSVDIPNVVPAALKAGGLRSNITEIKGESVGNFLSYVSARLVVSDLPPASTDQPDIDRALDKIDTPDFQMGPVWPASGQATVRQGFLKKPEVQYLIAHSSEAVPVMLKRLNSRNGFRMSTTQAVYFIVFEKSRDSRVLPALARFLDALPDSDAGYLGSPALPLLFAVDIIREMAPATLPATTDVRVLFRQRHQIAAQLRSYIHTQPQSDLTH